MSSTTFLSLLFLYLAFFTLSPSSSFAASSPTVYEMLQRYDFPVGLLPIGVESYEFDENTGKFTVHLDKTCTFPIESYTLRYKSKVTGVISKDKLSKLSGVQVKVLFIWLNIVEVTRDGDDLDFSVGVVSADFPLDNFYESPQCGCGFDCNGAGVEESGGLKFDSKHLVSSS